MFCIQTSKAVKLFWVTVVINMLESVLPLFILEHIVDPEQVNIHFL
jgi:hypothetical protein